MYTKSIDKSSCPVALLKQVIYGKEHQQCDDIIIRTSRTHCDGNGIVKPKCNVCPCVLFTFVLGFYKAPHHNSHQNIEYAENHFACKRMNIIVYQANVCGNWSVSVSVSSIRTISIINMRRSVRKHVIICICILFRGVGFINKFGNID